jgi:hypothetical protein
MNLQFACLGLRNELRAQNPGVRLRQDSGALLPQWALQTLHDAAQRMLFKDPIQDCQLTMPILAMTADSIEH